MSEDQVILQSQDSQKMSTMKPDTLTITDYVYYVIRNDDLEKYIPIHDVCRKSIS